MAVFHKLLVAVDGSEPSEAAVKLALRLAAQERARVLFVNVVEVEKVVASVVPGQGFADPTMAIDQLRANGGELLRAALAKAQAAGVQAESEIVDGDAADTIVELAKDKKADAIVLGSHGRAGFQRLLLGSVAEGVLRKSSVPVLIAKSGEA